LLTVARMYREIGNRDKAREWYHNVVEMGTSQWYSLDARDGLIDMLREEQRYEEAIAGYTELINLIDDADKERLGMKKMALGDTYREGNKIAEARKVYSEIADDEKLPEHIRAEACQRLAVL